MRTENIYSVYVHKNLKNEKYYVGCTKRNPKRRWNNGWGYQNNSQMWKDIQESNWNTDWVHGILGKFENEQDALKYESFLIAMLDSVNNGYNLSTFSHFGFTEKTKNKMSKSHTGDKNHMYGKHHSEETKKKMSKAKTGEKHPNFGKHLSEEHRKKMSEAHGVYGILQYSKTGEFIAEYPSTHEAERQTGCYQTSICACCKGKLKSTGGYIWKYKNGGLN